MGGFKDYLDLLEAKSAMTSYGAWGVVTKHGELMKRRPLWKDRRSIK